MALKRDKFVIFWHNTRVVISLSMRVAAAVKRARGLYFTQVRNNLDRRMLLVVVVAGAK
jgi:hypothetical protein